MRDLSFQQMQDMQRKLQEHNKDRWPPKEPQYARNHLLWMIGEIGEAIDIIKKCKEERIMEDINVREAFTEELCDILMYLNNIQLCFGISAEDIATAYTKKHNKNMNRDYVTENNNFSDNL